MNRLLLTAVVLLAASTRLQAQLNPAELEDASEFARRAAKAAVAGPPRLFVEALDTDAILRGRLGPASWSGLSERQRDQLRAVVRDRFLQSLAPSRSGASGDIDWSWASDGAESGTADVTLGLRFGERVLKTRWTIRPVAGGWRIANVVLSDPGISLAQASLGELGPEPVRRRERRREAERAAYPRLAALALIALTVVIVAPRLPRHQRSILYLTASAPAILFGVDAVLAVQRTLAESYAVSPASGRASWRLFEQRALDAERQGRVSEARGYWVRAIADGDPAGPIRYQMGLAAHQRGETEIARTEFERALAEKTPAPGAAKELAAIDVEQRRYAEAERELEQYLQMTGADPESLAMLAVIRTNLGKTSEALEAVRQARTLVGGGWRASELEAQMRARAGDAAGTVAALRQVESEGRVDRSALRSDPAYLSIATDPAWVSFLNERPAEKEKEKKN